MTQSTDLLALEKQGRLAKVHYIPSGNLSGLMHTYCGKYGYAARNSATEYEDVDGQRWEGHVQDWYGVTCKTCLRRKSRALAHNPAVEK